VLTYRYADDTGMGQQGVSVTFLYGYRLLKSSLTPFRPGGCARTGRHQHQEQQSQHYQ
jgi:hypothetical protein